jgi:hypothetical protein
MQARTKNRLQSAAAVAILVLLYAGLEALKSLDGPEPPSPRERLESACKQVVALNDRLSGITPRQGTKPAHARTLRPELWDLYRMTCDRQ